MKKYIIIGLVAVIIIAIGIAVYPGKTQIVTIPRIGTVSGPDVTFPYFTINGVRTEYRATPLKTATTTVCALRSPTDATSTLAFAGIKFTTSSTTATTVTIAKATTAFATTTIIGSAHTIAANAQDTINASSTVGVAADAGIFAPGNYLVVGMQGGTGTFSPVGYCQAEFIVN